MALQTIRVIGFRQMLHSGFITARSYVIPRLALFACAALSVSATSAYCGERSKHPADAGSKTDIVCVAGCRDTPPAVVGTASNVPAGPPLKSNLPDPNLVLRDVWCGDGGGCIALNHVAPPRLRDRDEHHVYISVWRPYW